MNIIAITQKIGFKPKPTIKRLCGFIGMLLLASSAEAVVQSASGSASTSTLFDNQDNAISLTWQVNPSASYTSANATVVNTVPTVNLAGNLDSPAKQEAVVITAAQVQTWLQQGYKTIVIRRSFNDPAGGGPLKAADVRFSLASSGLRAIRENSEFAIQRLQLSFDNQTNLTTVEPDAELFATLDVNYSGHGELQGYWQLAEPGSTEGLPLYRNLKLEKRLLNKAQHTRLRSPALPTQKPGKYLLRFCVVNLQNPAIGVDSFNCPEATQTVNAAYQVLAEAQTELSHIETNTDSASVTASTLFHWSAVADTAVYQLQIFNLQENNAVFVGGLLLSHSPTQASLNPMVLDKLTPGATYQWRIQSLNNNGQITGQSLPRRFVYQP